MLNLPLESWGSWIQSISSFLSTQYYKSTWWQGLSWGCWIKHANCRTLLLPLTARITDQRGKVGTGRGTVSCVWCDIVSYVQMWKGDVFHKCESMGYCTFCDDSSYLEPAFDKPLIHSPLAEPAAVALLHLHQAEIRPVISPEEYRDVMRMCTCVSD